MKITNIEWYIDPTDILNVLNNLTSEKAAETLGIPKETYANMSTAERNSYSYAIFRGKPQAKADIMGLPTEVEIPDDVDNIEDYLANEYEFCVEACEVSYEEGGKTRIYISDPKDKQKACDLLDENFISFDFDEGDRLMIDEDNKNQAIDIMEQNDIDYEII